MKKSSSFFSLVSSFGMRSLRLVRGWTKQNPYTIGVPFLLGLEAIILYGLNVSAEVAAAIGAGFCFGSIYFLAYVTTGGWQLSVDQEASFERTSNTHKHVLYTNVVAVLLLMGVLAIEIAVRLEGGLWGPMWLMLLHFGFVANSLLTFLIARFVFTGAHSPKRHKMWVYTFSACYVCTLLTGTTLLVQKFPIL